MNARHHHSLRGSWKRIRSLPGIGRNLVALAGAVVLGLVAGAGFLLSQDFTWPWAERFEFSAEFEEAPAIKPGDDQEVRIAGVKVGNVSAATVSPNGRALVTVAIDPGHPVYSDARLVLRPKSPLNDMYVELYPGGKRGKPLPEKGIIPVTQTERPVQADEVLAHLDDRTRGALQDLLVQSDVALAHAARDLPAGLRATDRTLVDLEPMVTALSTRRDKIAELVTSLAKVSAAAGGNEERLTRLADAMNSTLTVLAARDREVRDTLEALPGLSTELRRAMAGTSELTNELNPTLRGLREASGTLPPALARLAKTAETLGRTADLAMPVVRKARPVVADLRPFISDMDALLDDVEPMTRPLGETTAAVVPWLPNLQAFVYNTTSVFSLADADGGIVRGHLVVKADSPTGAAASSTKGGK